MRRRDQRGFALPSPVVLLSAVAILLAAVAWFATRGSGDDTQADLTASAPTSSAAPSPSPSSAPSTKPKPVKKHAAPALKKSKVSVVVYNNTHITGLAAQVGAKVQRAGWHFVAADDWHGTIPATTIYYGKRLKAAAKQLGLDLGISRTYPADTGAAGMLPDGLTVILLGQVG